MVSETSLSKYSITEAAPMASLKQSTLLFPLQGNYLYHVTWKGYGLEDSTWEPSSNLTSCEELLVEFFRSRLKKRDKEDPKSEE